MSRFFFTVAAFLSAVAPAFSMASRPPSDPSVPPPPAWVQFVPILVMVAIFYLLLIRPQSRQRQQREKMMKELKKGDRIVTTGGFFATINNITPDYIEVKLSEETKARIQRTAVADILPTTPTSATPEIVANGK